MNLPGRVKGKKSVWNVEIYKTTYTPQEHSTVLIKTISQSVQTIIVL